MVFPRIDFYLEQNRTLAGTSIVMELFRVIRMLDYT